MPINEDERKEIARKIMEQKKAMWKEEITSEQKQTEKPLVDETNQPSMAKPITPSSQADVIKKFESENKNDKEESKKSWLKQKLGAEIKKSSELDWKISFSVIVFLIGAIVLGIVTGYLSAILGLLKKI